MTPEKINKVRLGLALGWSKERIANGIACSTKTLVRYFSPELRERQMARDQMDLNRFQMTMTAAKEGNVGAMRLLETLIEKNDRMNANRQFDSRGEKEERAHEPKRGKKEAAQLAAQDVGGDGSLWGDDLNPGYNRPN